MTSQKKTGYSMQSALNILFVIVTMFFAHESAAQDAQGCGKVVIDCSTHKMKIGDGEETTIDCGRDGSTPNCENGKVGGLHSGDIVKDGVTIQNCGNMEQTGKVFHMPLGGGDPTGHDVSKGCIHVNQATLTELKKCQGSPLSITGNGGSNNGDPYYGTQGVQGSEGSQSGTGVAH